MGYTFGSSTATITRDTFTDADDLHAHAVSLRGDGVTDAEAEAYREARARVVALAGFWKRLLAWQVNTATLRWQDVRATVRDLAGCRS